MRIPIPLQRVEFIRIKEKVVLNVKLKLLSSRLNQFFPSEAAQKPHGLKPPSQA